MDFGETSALAKRLGLNFDPARHYALADDYSFLPFLAHGGNRYVFNVLSGRVQGNEIMAFDFHYEKPEQARDNELTNSHHYLTTAMVLMPGYFPELRIVPENMWSKIEESIGRGILNSNRLNLTVRFAFGPRTSGSPAMSAIHE